MQSVFPYYSSCFDTLSRSILYDKLESYGIRGVGLVFIKAYFENRSQYVCCDAVNLSINNQELGVNEGSKTYPLFFDRYSNDFARICSSDESKLYANDTVLIYSTGQFIMDFFFGKKN